MFLKQKGTIPKLNSYPLKLVKQFTYLGRNISPTESDINIRLMKAWTAIDRLSIIQKSDLSDKIKQNCFQVVAASILLYRYTTLTLIKR